MYDLNFKEIMTELKIVGRWKDLYVCMYVKVHVDEGTGTKKE